MVTVGLTGGIATGKSVVSKILSAKPGVVLVDADRISRDVCAIGTVGLSAIVQRFGAKYIADDGSLDRRALGALVVDDIKARRDLEAILHPLISTSIARRKEQARHSGALMYVVEAALMVETGSYAEYDILVVVSCRKETQVARLTERENIDFEIAKKWISTQLPLAEKTQLADHIIRNDGSLEELRQAVERLVAEILPN